MAAKHGKSVELQIPCDPKYIAITRLVVAGVATHAGLNVDDIDDLKVAVSEACTNVIQHAFTDEQVSQTPAAIVVRFIPQKNELRVEVEDFGAGFEVEQTERLFPDQPSFEGGLGLYLIKQLTDEVEIQSAPGSGTKVIMTKRATR